MPHFLKKIKKKAAAVAGAFGQQNERRGLLVTSELNKALEECKAKVARISKDCRAKNRKFRDIEFDLENDRYRCLHGLSTDEELYNPSDVQRVTQIFENPQFFVDGADSNDIIQGALGDCWFLSALATMATAKGLVERFCVARDEYVGVYGFIFFRDSEWKIVIIDDMLFTSIPKFEELSAAEKHLYHNDKEFYNNSARKGGATLYFARSGTQGETWVPLIEKAYAKLHGDYASLSGGEASEAIEDLTGGVSTIIPTKDILDIDRFWKEELLNANKDRLFGCAYDALDTSRSGEAHIEVSGLIGGHAYSVLRAVECRGKRFVIIRNPWGASEWNGPWSDGSKEWTPEWLEILPEIGHVFGDDGQFIMEYRDFLESWEQVDRTLLFDSSWVMSSQWLRVVTRPLPSAWSYGDVSFTFCLPATSPALIVLSKLDERYFQDISGRYAWNFNFVLFKKGETECLAESSHSRFWSRSVNLEVGLEAGEYVVHVRLDRRPYREEGYLEKHLNQWNQRKLSRILTERALSQAIAANFKEEIQTEHLPVPLSLLAGQDLSVLECKVEEEAEKATDEQEGVEGHPTPQLEEMTGSKGSKNGPKAPGPKFVPADGNNGEDDEGDKDYVPSKDGSNGQSFMDDPLPPAGLDASKIIDDDAIFLGLRVYSNKAAPAVVGGQLRHELEIIMNKPSQDEGDEGDE